MELLEKQDMQEQKQYGGFGRRLGAYIIDSIIVGIPIAIITIFIFFIAFGTSETLVNMLMDPYADPDYMTDEQAIEFLFRYLGAIFATAIISFLGTYLYFVLFHISSWQATLGKKMLGLQVTDINGNKIGFGRATGRYFAMAFLSGILLIGYLMAAFTEKKQSLHDLIAGTVVVKK